MKYAIMLALLVACGDEAPKTESTKAEPAKVEVQKDAAKAETQPTEVKNVEVKKEEPAKARTGEEVYGQVCVTCHQATGQGLAGAFPPLAGSDWMGKSNEVLIKIVLHGLMGEVEVSGQKYNSVMAPWGAQLNDQEIANVLTHVRSSWGNTGAAVTAEEVKAVRDANQGHAPWTAADLN